ncbi:MAG: hypothetical protein ACM3SS_20490 [Rhodospirillaceae bacterium]
MRSLAFARSCRSRDSSLPASPLLGEAPAVVAPGWLPEVLLTLGVSAPLEAPPGVAGTAALPGEVVGAVALLAAGEALSAAAAGGTLGSPPRVDAGAAGVVDDVSEDGAAADGAPGVSTFVSLLHAEMEVAIAAALTETSNRRIDI